LFAAVLYAFIINRFGLYVKRGFYAFRLFFAKRKSPSAGLLSGEGLSNVSSGF
jgi:hypothetical protein